MAVRGGLGALEKPVWLQWKEKGWWGPGTSIKQGPRALRSWQRAPKSRPLPGFQRVPWPPRLLQVDILVMAEPSSGRWVHLDTEITNSSGRITYSVPRPRRLGVGVYPVKMVVRSDPGDVFTVVSPNSTALSGLSRRWGPGHAVLGPIPVCWERGKWMWSQL